MPLTLGTDEGYAEPGLPGATNPFPQVNLHAPQYQRLVQNRIAGLSNEASTAAVPNINDVVMGHRSVYAPKRYMGYGTGLPSRLLFAYDPAAAVGYTELSALPSAATGTVVDVTGKAIATPGNMVQLKGGGLLAAVGLVTAPVARNNDLFAQWLTYASTDLAATTKYLVRVTDTNNWIGIHRQSATNLRVERNVASVVATERDITIPASTPVNGNAIGIRLSGTSAAVYLNGTRVDSWTLNAAAQGLAGTLSGILFAAGGNLLSLVDCWEVWKTTD